MKYYTNMWQFHKTILIIIITSLYPQHRRVSINKFLNVSSQHNIYVTF